MLPSHGKTFPTLLMHPLPPLIPTGTCFMPDPRDMPMACQNRQDVASRALLESLRSKQLACLDV